MRSSWPKRECPCGQCKAAEDVGVGEIYAESVAAMETALVILRSIPIPTHSVCRNGIRDRGHRIT
jgi:hypothetical protein